MQRKKIALHPAPTLLYIKSPILDRYILECLYLLGQKLLKINDLYPPPPPLAPRALAVLHKLNVIIPIIWVRCCIWWIDRYYYYTFTNITYFKTDIVIWLNKSGSLYHRHNNISLPNYLVVLYNKNGVFPYHIEAEPFTQYLQHSSQILFPAKPVLTTAQFLLSRTHMI